MSDTATIPEHPGAPAAGLSGESDASRRGKERWAAMSEADKAAHREKVKAGQQKRRERDEGKRGGDDAPKPKRRSAGAAAIDTKTDDLDLIRRLVGTVLTAPAAIGAATRDPWLTQHFMQQGPALADAVVEEAARNDAFRAYMVRIAKAARGVSILGALAMYVAPVLMHYNAIPGAALLGVPVVEGPPPEPTRAAPVPGSTPPFVAPEHGPAEAPKVQSWVDAPDPGWIADVADQAQVPADELAAELAGAEGAMPPLPLEPV
jgi:hypothetical protein